MPRENITITILFADIANSTRLYDTLGNKDARKLISDCLSLLQEACVRHKGTVIKTIGDEIMCTFPGADDAVAAAIDMNRDLVNMSTDDMPEGTFPPNIYVGIQQGPVIREENDVFGDAVNVAAHMVTLAKQRQIITTKKTIEALNLQYQDASRLIDQATIKGKAGNIDIYEILWEQKDETIMMDVNFDTLLVESNLELRFEDQTIEVGPNRPDVTLGRQNHNDLVVNDVQVSRTHARIEYRRGKFVLIDQSSNGTYAFPQNGGMIRVKRDESPIHGSGVISLGRKIDPDLSNKFPLIQYRIRF